MKINSEIFNNKFSRVVVRLTIVALTLLFSISFLGCESKSKSGADVPNATAYDNLLALDNSSYSNERLGKTKLPVDYIEIKRVEEFTHKFFETVVSGDYEAADKYLEHPLFYRDGVPNIVTKAYFDRFVLNRVSYVSSSDLNNFATQHYLQVYVSVIDIHKISRDHAEDILRHRIDDTQDSSETQMLSAGYISDPNAPRVTGFINVYVLSIDDELIIESTVFDDLGIRF